MYNLHSLVPSRRAWRSEQYSTHVAGIERIPRIHAPRENTSWEMQIKLDIRWKTIVVRLSTCCIECVYTVLVVVKFLCGQKQISTIHELETQILQSPLQKTHANFSLIPLHPIWPSSSVDPNLQRGCLEALHCLSLHYPPPSLPHLWGCVQSTCTLLAILQEVLNCSRLAWGIQGTHSCHVPFLVSNPRSTTEAWLQSDTASSWNVEVGKHGLRDYRVNFLHPNQWYHLSIMVSLPLAHKNLYSGFYKRY